jgi:hypothetical protein
VSAIDLGGGDGSNGGNTLQATASIGSSPNRDAGICLAVAANQPGVTGTLSAKGNLFAGVDCSSSVGPIKSDATCSGGVDKSVLARGGASNSNKIDTTMCP